MTKPIKFNLILDGKPVRDIEGLKENFNIEDLMEHYKCGLLQRWLKVREFDDLADKVKDRGKRRSGNCRRFDGRLWHAPGPAVD